MITIKHSKTVEIRFNDVDDCKAYLQLLEQNRADRPLCWRSVAGQIKDNVESFLVKIDPFKPQRSV